LRYDTVAQKTVTPQKTIFDPEAGEETRNNDALSPRVGLVYQPIEELSLYASYSQSFNPTTETTFNGDPLEPERGRGYEAGVKAELLAGKLLTTLAYFDITKQNVATPDPNSPSGFGSVATGEQRSRGMELDATGQILPGWNIIAAYAYTDAKVTQDNDVPIGNRLFGTPKHSASLWTTYELQSSNLQGLGFGVGFNYVGDREGDLLNSFEVESYFIPNAAIFYRRNNWRVGLNFRNLFNANYIEAVANNRADANIPGEPFTVIGSFSVDF
jgi:iron complex outermembrane receptor protein